MSLAVVPKLGQRVELARRPDLDADPDTDHLVQPLGGGRELAPVGNSAVRRSLTTVTHLVAVALAVARTK